MSEELKTAIDQFCRSLQSLWRLEAFKPSFWSYQTRRRASTVATQEAELLPVTQRPIRGRPGVEVQRPERQWDLDEHTRRLILESLKRPESFHAPELRDQLTDVSSKLDAIEEIIDGSPVLSYRLYQAPGFKTWSPEEFLKIKQSEGWSNLHSYSFTLANLFAAQLVSLGFEPSDRASFSEWEKVSLNVDSELAALEALESYEYEVQIFLNGPTIDSDEEAEVAYLRIGDRPIEVTIGYASDEMMRPLVEYGETPGFGKVNTVVRYKIPVPVDLGEDAYEAEYANAARVAELVLDCLRLYRPDEDIGVLALEVLPTQVLTPSIRKTWYNRFNGELARFQPRRFDFAPPSPEPLSSEELENLKGTVLELLPVQDETWRYSHAIERFRRSIEAYSPSDPERILEYAIALEALYLSDCGKGRGELTYRLALRAARFLESEIDKRQKVFSLVTKLYNFRSRISHGEDISRMTKPREQEDLKLVLERGPSIVARSILRLLQGPADVQSDPSEFWRSIELG